MPGNIRNGMEITNTAMPSYKFIVECTLILHGILTTSTVVKLEKEWKGAAKMCLSSFFKQRPTLAYGGI